ncbi:VOC family protein [Pararhodobacter oceanensis]|uniref:VOC family protein n=1 Tax=Pararhodobacter oceanensis TaxID=2172121 RepID=UPI00198225CF|nr:VOC family protein [Pararhodobacter oceanensis]
MTQTQKIAPCLWFDGQALEAAEFYTSVFANSRIDHIMRSGHDWPAGKAGDVILVEFTLDGVAHQALNGGPSQTFSEAVSLSVVCEDQAELDRIWNGLLAGGGEEVQCGWLRDRFGMRWQLVPRIYWQMIHEGTQEQVTRVMAAMFAMVKFDIAALEEAFDAGA